MTRGNQRDTDRARAQARKDKYSKDGKSNLKTAESDAEKLRAKQAAADARKAAEAAKQQTGGGGVVKQKFDVK